jgi:hypothetical protein
VAVTDVCQATVSPDGEELCITDGSSYYENEEVCRFTFTGEGALLNKEFDLERRWDTMTIAGTSYDGRSNAMNNLALTGTTAFKFESDSDITRRGFKFCVALPTESKGSVCTSTVAWADGSTTKPVGWVGAGPGADYCNIWKCEIGESEFTEQDFTGTFRKQVRQCSIEEHGDSFCSHTSCTFSGSPEVIRVHSDHREEVGGFHKCGLSQHALARSADRPACDCICHGARRQDAAGFMRSMNEVRTAAGTSNPGYGFRGVYGNHDATTDYDTPNDFDATHNSNNFYSKHSNNGQYVHTNAAEAARTDTYNQKDQSYRGQQVAHVHIDN